MYNVPTITASLAPITGFRQQYDTQLQPLDADMLLSSSGLIFQDAHALVTLDNIDAIKPLESEIVFELWDSTKAYKAGAVVKDSNTPYNLYLCIKDIPGGGLLLGDDGGDIDQDNGGGIIINSSNIPLTNTTYWMLTNWTSCWLRDKRNASVRQVVAAIAQKQQLAANAKTLLDNNNLFEGTANFGDLETNMSRFVGFEIVLNSDNNLVDYISKIGTQFSLDSLPATFNIYLYHTSQSDPVKVIPVTVTKSLSLEWRASDITIGYQTAVTDSGGKWFLGYYEADISGNAVNKQYNFLTGPCNNCLGQETAYASYKRRIKYASITPFAVASSKLNTDRTLWDWTANNVSYNLKTWGLNFTQTFKCDLTDFISSQAFLFARAIQLQFACDIISEMAHSPRFNRNQENAQAKAFRALGDKDTPGLYALLQDEINSVSFDISDLSPLCQPCVAARGVRYGSV